MDREMCCGGRMYSMGYRDEFTGQAKAYLKLLAEAGITKVITACADGYHTFKHLYSQLDSRIEVFHITEIIDQLIKEEKLTFHNKIPVTVTYHDPCHLGRQGEPYIPWKGKQKKIKGQIIVYEPKKPRYNGARGVYDPPRNILNSIPGITLIEMERIREYSWCCGAGGGVREAYPEFALWTANERITEAGATGARTLVSACPWCEKMFRDAVRTTGVTMEICDITGLVQKAL
jgi:Fe-S oxidoreductase